MPHYRYYCVLCGEFEEWRSIHAEPLETHHCGNTVAKIINPPALHGIGVRGAETRRVDNKEKQWSKDMPAYERLRMEGYQPRRIDGADKLEATALGNWEIETGQKYDDKTVYTAQEQARQIIRDAAAG